MAQGRRLSRPSHQNPLVSAWNITRALEWSNQAAHRIALRSESHLLLIRDSPWPMVYRGHAKRRMGPSPAVRSMVLSLSFMLDELDRHSRHKHMSVLNRSRVSYKSIIGRPCVVLHPTLRSAVKGARRADAADSVCCYVRSGRSLPKRTPAISHSIVYDTD